MSEPKIVTCSFVPAGVIMPASFDGHCPACGELISKHAGVTLAITADDLKAKRPQTGAPRRAT